MLFRRQAVEANRTRLYGTVIIATPFSYWIISVFLLSIIAAAVFFGANSSFARIQPVRGVITPTDGLTAVRAPTAGTLREFSLREGDIITAGQDLGQIFIHQEVALQGTRMQAELDRIAERIESATRQREQIARVNETELDVIGQDTARIMPRIASNERVLALQRAAYVEMEEAFALRRDLAERNLLPAATLANERMQLFAAEQQIIEAEAEIADLRNSLSVLAAREKETAARGELSILQIEAELESLFSEQEILKGSQAFRITSNSAGRATAVVVKDGDAVQAGEPLFSVLPLNENLEAELYVPSRAIGFVELGLPVRLLIDAFPYQQFGTIGGAITDISTTVLQPATQDLMTPVDEPVFRVKVRLLETNINASGADYPVQIGMALTGNIVLESRTLLAWVLAPVLSVMNRS